MASAVMSANPPEPPTAHPVVRLVDAATATRRRVYLLVAVLAVLTHGYAVFYVPFFGDETGWVRAAYKSSATAWAGDTHWNAWRQPEEGPWGAMNPQLGKWLIGFPILAYYRAAPGHEVLPYPYEWARSYQFNERHDRVPEPGALFLGRLSSALFGVGAILVMTTLSMRALGRSGALLAGALAAVTPILMHWFGRAMTDSHYNFFMMLCLACLAAACTGAGRFRRWGWLLAAGATLGLATSVKIIAPVVIVPLLLLLLSVLVARRRLRLRGALSAVLLVGVCSLTLVYALNPFYWPVWGAIEPDAVGREWQRIWHPGGALA